MIVHSLDPITLIGGSLLDRSDLNKSLTIAPTVVAADGGVRHLTKNDPDPKAIIGDFDSLPKDAEVAYPDRLHRVAEQDTTDFEKVLQRVDAPLFLALGFLGGRIDHSFSALNVVARHAKKSVILFGQQDILLRVPGHLRLTMPIATPLALLPMGDAKVWTTGLKWDMTAAVLAPNGMVSSSNAVANAIVDIRVEGSVLLTLPKALLDGLISAVRAE